MSKSTLPALPKGYIDWLTQLKDDTTETRQRATLAN